MDQAEPSPGRPERPRPPRPPWPQRRRPAQRDQPPAQPEPASQAQPQPEPPLTGTDQPDPADCAGKLAAKQPLTEADHPVVVGYDGSAASRNALAYAAGMARRLGRTLLVAYI